MPSKPPRSNPQQEPRDAPGGPDSAASTAGLTRAAQAWTDLLDDWWRQQSAALPPDLERAMSATLDQSKALVDMAFAQAAAAGRKTAAAADPTPGARPEDLPTAGAFGLWQPVIEACRACEASLVGNAGEGDAQPTGAAREYQRAASAYLNEFLQINGVVAQRLQQKLAASPPADFRQLHALVVEEVENAYLDRVSTDNFAALQADFINAMFRLRKESADAGSPERS